ncbi:MAG: ABC transporter ATP-binding protein [Chloroflexi bacterium]|nr:ABC transporter ATP-binding protein [Chloroflexota bacterium]
MTDEYVEFREVDFAYHGGTPVLSQVELTLRRGEFFLLLGPSGCGKTTVLNLLAGFERPTAGEIAVNGRRITGPGVDRAVIFQGDDSLLGWLSAVENVEFGLRLAGVPGPERRRRSEEALRLVGLDGQSRKAPHQLSGGMKQRVQIARALVVDSDILLMDEPFAALDAQTRATLQDELARLWVETRRTILFITHDIGEAIILADRIGVMHAGPGSRVKEIILNDLPRPRRRGAAAFAAMYDRIERIVAEEVHRTMQREAVGHG